MQVFSPMVSRQAGGQWEKACLGCILETIRCRKLKLGRDIGWGWGGVWGGGGGGCVGVQCHGVTYDLTLLK